MRMKKLTILLAAAALLTSCYEDYVRDYGKSGVYFAYQYDLRSFVIGEGAEFDVTVALGGVMSNDHDRAVRLSFDNSLVDAAAYNGMLGTGDGLVSGDYVGTALQDAAITALTPLPAERFVVTGLDGLAIRAGRHTATVKVKATDGLFTDPKAFTPGYAFGVRILSADADEVVAGKDFAVIAVKCENRFFGHWVHSGIIRSYDASGNLTGTARDVGTQADDKVYTLTTVDANTVSCPKMTGMVGGMTLAFDGTSITVNSADGTVTGTGVVKDTRLLQDRELALQYDIVAGDGSKRSVLDTLRFRNRIRDGVNEWQDENPEHYQ